ncbi:hypothetical protein GCM10028784_01020 [Myceligenerans cantabricum]
MREFAAHEHLTVELDDDSIALVVPSSDAEYQTALRRRSPLWTDTWATSVRLVVGALAGCAAVFVVGLLPVGWDVAGAVTALPYQLGVVGLILAWAVVASRVGRSLDEKLARVAGAPLYEMVDDPHWGHPLVRVPGAWLDVDRSLCTDWLREVAAEHRSAQRIDRAEALRARLPDTAPEHDRNVLAAEIARLRMSAERRQRTVTTLREAIDQRLRRQHGTTVRHRPVLREPSAKRH